MSGTTAELFNQALQRHQAGDLQSAAELYRSILDSEPRHADATHHMGVIALQQGRPDLAIQFISHAVALNPRVPDYHSNLALAYQRAGLLIEAVASCQQALNLRPDSAEAHHNLASILAQLGRFEEATAHQREVVRLKPGFAEGHNNLGLALVELRQREEAAACFRKALSLKQNYAEAFNNLGDVLSQQGQLDEAMENFHEALRLVPHNPKILNNIGLTLKKQGKLDEARDYLEQSLRQAPDYVLPHYNLALLWLIQGDFARGWPEHEWRAQLRDYAGRTFAEPRWDGSPLAGRTILIHAEQGLGDTIQFIRYAPLVKELGGRVIVECPQPLLGLLASCSGIDELIAQGEPLPSFDVQIPMLSLPYVFKTTLSTIPANVPYLSADAELVGRWCARLDKETKRQGDKETSQREPVSLSPCLPVSLSGLRIGAVWQGNPEYGADRQRSATLAAFAPLAAAAGVKLYSLQQGVGREQIGAVPFSVTDLGNELSTFADTAALLKNLDLVVTVDTAVAHCAGALGLPVWLLLSEVADWRWLLHREDSPWYPTMRLFRQSKLGDWTDVFQRIAHEVTKLTRVEARVCGEMNKSA